MCTQQTASGMSDPALLAGRFLNRYPAMKYVQQPGELNIALVGCAPELKDLRNAFFTTIFSSVHMLDTKLHIHILSEDAGEYCRSLQKSMPLLSGTTCISLDGHPDSTPLDSRVVYEPLAYLDFRTADNNWTTLFSDVFSSWDCGYVLMFDPIFQQDAMKDALSAHFSGKTALLAFPGQEEDSVFDSAWKSLPSSTEHEPDIWDQAKKVHIYYSRTFDPRITCGKIDATFDVYSQSSSIRCALSIPCKLAACGIYTRGKDAAMEFHKKALADTPLLDKLSWLEHRSWQAYMITQGFDLLDPGDTANWDKLYRLPKPKNRIETTALKKHPCLCASKISSPPIDWETLDTANLDPLDRISVELYNLCDQRATDPAFKAERDNEFKAFRDKVPSAHQPLVYELGIVMERMFAQESNINKMWQRLCRELESKKDITSDAKKCLKDLKTSMGIVEARNQRKDYKKIDTELIQAIPYLEIQDSVQTIYKIHSSTVWKNVISSLHIAPRKLYLVILSGDPADDVYQNHKTWCQELLNKRGLTNTTVEVVSIDAVNPDREGSIVDVTGITAEELMSMHCHPLNDLPMIWHKNNALDSWGRREIQFFARGIDLTVEESISISGANSGAEVFADTYDEPLLMLKKAEYDALWDMVGKYKKKYSNCVSALKAALVYDDKDDTFKDTCVIRAMQVSEQDIVTPAQRITITSSGSDLVAQGFTDILTKLAQLKLIVLDGSSVLTPNQVVFSGHYKTLNEALEDFIKTRSMSTDPADKYELGLEANHKYTNKPTAVLQSTNLTVSISMAVEGDSLVHKNNKVVKVSVMENFLKDLKQKGLISGLTTTSSTTFNATFCFASKAVRSCLVKEGNALEAFAYHTIATSNLFDDVKLSVNVVWGKSKNTTNEIDVICTKGIHTYMISCKQRSNFKKDVLHEINDHASQFGVCPTTILLTTAQRQSNPNLWERADNMGIYPIFLTGDPAQDATELVKELKKIIKKTIDFS